MNNNKKKNDPKSAAIIGAVIVFFSIMSGIAEGGDPIGVIIAIAVLAVVVVAVIKKTGETKKKEQSLAEKVYAAVRPSSPANCDYGDANCDYSHDYKRRVEQLDAFLKNGTIDRAEYNVLLERYRKNYEEHKD